MEIHNTIEGDSISGGGKIAIDCESPNSCKPFTFTIEYTDGGSKKKTLICLDRTGALQLALTLVKAIALL